MMTEIPQRFHRHRIIYALSRFAAAGQKDFIYLLDMMKWTYHAGWHIATLSLYYRAGLSFSFHYGLFQMYVYFIKGQSILSDTDSLTTKATMECVERIEKLWIMFLRLDTTLLVPLFSFYALIINSFSPEKNASSSNACQEKTGELIAILQRTVCMYIPRVYSSTHFEWRL